MDRRAWRATVHRVARVRHDLATKPPPPPGTAIRRHHSQATLEYSFSLCHRHLQDL